MSQSPTGHLLNYLAPEQTEESKGATAGFPILWSRECTGPNWAALGSLADGEFSFEALPFCGEILPAVVAPLSDEGEEAGEFGFIQVWRCEKNSSDVPEVLGAIVALHGKEAFRGSHR